MRFDINNTKHVNIYELRDPRDSTKSPRYVGITTKELYNILIIN